MSPVSRLSYQLLFTLNYMVVLLSCPNLSWPWCYHIHEGCHQLVTKNCLILLWKLQVLCYCWFHDDLYSHCHMACFICEIDTSFVIGYSQDLYVLILLNKQSFNNLLKFISPKFRIIMNQWSYLIHFNEARNYITRLSSREGIVLYTSFTLFIGGMDLGVRSRFYPTWTWTL